MLRTCTLCLLFACTRPAVQAPRLQPGDGTARTLAGGEKHRYEIELASDTTLLAAVDQLGADVIVSTYGPDGALLGTFDSPTGNRSTEQVRIDAKQAGTYRVEVTTFPGYDGSYRARVVEIVATREIAAREAKEQAAVAQFFDDRRELVDGFVAWAKQTAIGDDLAGIDKLVAGARVIALGEAEHGVREYLAYRNRLAKHLVENGLVTAIAVESGLTEATAVDDYVTGVGTATSREVAPALFTWAMPAALQDNVELVEWLRAYNAKAARKVRVYGIDVTGGRNGEYTESRRAIDAALAYLAQHDQAAHRRLEPRLAPLVAKFSGAGYLELDDARREALTAVIGELLAAFKTAPDTAEARRARQHAAMAAVLETYFRQTRDRSTQNNLADVSLDGIRDATMAANVAWVLGEEGPDSRVFLFTHNVHARRCPVTAWPAKIPMSAAMGQYLAKSLRDKLVVIGFLHGDGPPTATLDGLFARVGLPRFLVDLRAAPETVRAGLSEPWKLRADSFRVSGLEPAWSVPPAACFDAFAFTNTSTDAPLAR